MRRAEVQRKTKETDVSLSLNLDGDGSSSIATGVGFFDHMLEQLIRHSVMDAEIHCQGDTHVDDHHTVEDVGIALGQATNKALGDRAGIQRFGHAFAPLDESLSRVVIDFSGRPLSVFSAHFYSSRIKSFDTELVAEFFRAYATHARATLHARCLYGNNAHHIAETLFKALGRAIRAAASHDPKNSGTIPSTKGRL